MMERHAAGYVQSLQLHFTFQRIANGFEVVANPTGPATARTIGLSLLQEVDEEKAPCVRQQDLLDVVSLLFSVFSVATLHQVSSTNCTA